MPRKPSEPVRSRGALARVGSIVTSAMLVTCGLGIDLAYHASPAVGTVEQKINLLARLLDAPSTTERVAASIDQSAAAHLRTAREAHDAALAALAHADHVTAEARAAEGLRAVAAALRASGPATTPTNRTAEHYYAARERTLKFAEALDRAVLEKGLDADALLDRAQWRASIDAANRFAEQDDFGRANDHLKSAEQMIEVALSTARHNETLIHELKFDDPADAYRYELKRNDTYSMLVDVFERRGSQVALVELKDALEANETVRVRAAALFESGDVTAAIELLEQSTEDMAAALRRSGMGF